MSRLLSLTVLLGTLLALGLADARAQDAKTDDTPNAAKTRKLLKTKISVEIKNTRLEDAVEELKEQVKGLKVLLDTKGGVSRNQQVTVVAKDATVEEVLDKMLGKNGLGYIVISKKGDAYDGLLQIRQSNERGYPKKK
jgi:hypothetical protein